LGPIIEMASISITRTAARCGLRRVRRDWRVLQHRSARCEQRGVHSNRELSVAKLGTDGPARRSRWVSPAWWTGPPPIPCCEPPRATNRMTRPPRPSPPQEAARGFWIRAWSQREPALQGTGRSSDPAPWLGWLEGGLDDPHHSRRNFSHRVEHPIRTVAYRALVTRRSNPDLCLSCDNCLLESRSPPRDASAGRSRPWPGCCPRRRVCPIPGTVDSW